MSPIMNLQRQAPSRPIFIHAMRNLIVALTITFPALLVFQCKQRNDHPPAAVQRAEGTYVCPMHPQVTSDKPGQCPICGMDLVIAGAGDLMLTATQERLANIRVQRVSPGSMTSEGAQVERTPVAAVQNWTVLRL